ncbi:MAG: Ig domain-containing protein, partial [bacterium]
MGGTAALAASPRTAAGAEVTGRTVSWNSGTPGVATVNAAGVVTAVAPGSATVTATVDGVTGSAAVTVTQMPV